MVPASAGHFVRFLFEVEVVRELKDGLVQMRLMVLKISCKVLRQEDLKT